jgi:hypothetical protein
MVLLSLRRRKVSKSSLRSHFPSALARVTFLVLVTLPAIIAFLDF